MLSLLRGLFLANWGTKIMALILAIITFWYIQHERIVRDTLKVSIVIETPSQITSRVEDTNGEPLKGIEVIVERSRGASSDITNNMVYRRQLKPTNEAPDKPQTIILEPNAADFNAKPGVTVKDWNPKRIQVVLMQESSKYMKIKTEDTTQGAPPKGYRVAGVKAIPSEISVKGPKNILDKYSEIPMTKIDVSNRNSAFSQVGRIESLENTKLSTEDAFIVEVGIEEELSETVVTAKIGLLIPTDFPHFPIQIKPQEKALKFRGPASSIKELKPRHISLFVNVGNLYTNPQDIKPGQSFAPRLELRLTDDAPKDIELAEPLDQIKLEVLPETQPAPTGQAPAPDKTPK